MTTEMLTDQIFRIKGLKGRTAGLDIEITASYISGSSKSVKAVSAYSGNCFLDGLSVIVGEDVLDVGRSFQSTVTSFSVTISSVICDIDKLSLQYALCGAAEAMKQDFFPQYSRLNYDRILFTLEGGRFIVEMTRSGGSAEITENASDSGIYTMNDIIGDIGSDIKMISYYPDSRGREELESALRELLKKAEVGNVSVAELSDALSGYESKITELINSSADYFKGSGKHLLEKTAGTGR